MSVRGILFYTVAPDRSADGSDAALERIAAQLSVSRTASLANEPQARRLSLGGMVLAHLARRTLGWNASAAIHHPSRAKPWFPDGPDFSVSHSGTTLGCAAVTEGAVGFDVEADARARTLTLHTILAPEEREWAERLGAAPAFALKEAVLKAGGGTIEHLAEVRLTADGGEFRGVHYYAQRLPPLRCAAALVASEPDIDWEWRALEWDGVMSDASVSSILPATTRAGREA